MGVAYFVRGAGESWAVVRLFTDDREEIVADGLSQIEAEILCAMKLEDLPRTATGGEEPLADDTAPPRAKRARQLAFKF